MARLHSLHFHLMEHLSLPRGAKILDSERAFCIADSYDGGSFLSYPQRSRFSDLYQKLTQHGWPSTSWQVTSEERLELDVFLQTWLFFGLIHEVFDARAPASKFVDQQCMITTVRLPAIVNGWLSDRRAFKDDDNVFLQHLSKCITKAWHTCLTACRTTKVSVSILRSIAALCETLEDVVFGTLSFGPRTIPTNWGWMHNFNEVAATMVMNGWCPADALKFRAAANTFHAVYYLSKLELHVRRDHSRCVGTACVANQSEDYYVAAQHTPQCDQGCNALGVDENKLMAILGEGKVAILDISLSHDDSTMVVDVVSAEEDTKYVAISHVWADGLGNPSGNTLSRCQIARIARIVKGLAEQSSPIGSKLYIWLDTLCCPVNSRFHRAKCLALMRQIYHEAAHVLVLDAQLKQYDSREIDSLEICARILFSVWSTRLWTLQEGALARRGGLWIQLRDRAVNLDILGDELIRRYGTHLIDGHLTLVLSSDLARLRRFIDAGTGYSAANLVDLRMAIKSRQVSVATDEPLCLATCMNLDQVAIVQAAPEERMSEFWLAMRQSGREIPSNILFFYGERMSVPGLRWAPVSFLERIAFNKFWRPRRNEEVAVMTDLGLQVQFPACEIVMPNSGDREWDNVLEGLESEIPIRHSPNRWYRLLIGCGVPGPWSKLSTVKILRRNGGNNVLITEPALDELSFDHEGANLSQAISGSITSTTSDGVCLSVETTVLIGLMTEQDAYVHEKAFLIAQTPEFQEAQESILRTSLESSVLPDHERLSRLSNSVLQRVLRVAEFIMGDEVLKHFPRRASSPSSTFGLREQLAEYIVRFLGGWYGRTQQTWPRTQRWFVD